MALAIAWSAVSIQHCLVYPVPDKELVVQEFTFPEHWPRAYGVDIRWNTLGAVWSAHDPDSDVLYLYSEYRAEADPAIHAAAIRSHGDWILGLRDPSTVGTRRTGGALMRIYRDLGLKLESINNPIESGILELGQRMRSGRLKVFALLPKYLEERRLYRRDPVFGKCYARHLRG
jgi:hypothetical protein